LKKNKVVDYSSLLTHCKSLLDQPTTDKFVRLTEICVYLQKEAEVYDWVGFYMTNHAEKTLHLKAFAGISTNHEVIPFGKGICGQVAVSNDNFLVDDVSAQDNYIACDIHVKSEIVIPLFSKGINIGQIDIDSNKIKAFTEKDAKFLEQLNTVIAEKLF
jgi:GAF domain-containing protein